VGDQSQTLEAGIICNETSPRLHSHNKCDKNCRSGMIDMLCIVDIMAFCALDRGSLTFATGRSPVKIWETRGLESRIEVK